MKRLKLFLFRSCPRIQQAAACLLLVLLFSGCSSFNRQWKKAAAQPASATDILGRWQGTWRSDVNGHNDPLRCLITRNEHGKYQARFHAKYHKVLTFGYTVKLDVTPMGDSFQFQGDANLHWWAGGMYHYEGKATPTNFFSTYRCKYDHGTFRMTRP
jgi:hypothetical protein